MSVVYVVGARPNFVKMAPVVQQMRLRAPELRHVVVHTGQHYDREMSDIFFEDLGLPAPDHLLGVGSGGHGVQTARALERLEAVFADERPDLVVVPGDVNSTLSAALAASKMGIPVAHLESGLRSFDRTMPEEINRLLVDQISEWCFIHSPEAEDNLLREGIPGERIAFVGNTMIDTLVRVRERVADSRVLAGVGVAPHDYLLVTLHRPALVDGPLFADVMRELGAIARELPVVFPMHPRTRSRLDPDVAAAPGLSIVDPVGYVDFLALQSQAAGVITDSGGVQEETTFLRVPCFTLRENTERPVTITEGTNRLLGLRPEALREVLPALGAVPLQLRHPRGWDGDASVRVADVLLDAEALAPAASYATDGR
ncbi:MAG TPA: UDP-N-acetylglucosamine 2-epimerase (non-hydrolyzing) [Baekduia sp.]|nr:UDP-N-acetylglucosamine 2-epimerase (non-hydrolyzing) [Baekduia sp.]